MKKRIVLSALLSVLALGLYRFAQAMLAPAEAELAVAQVRDSEVSYGATTFLLRSNILGYGFVAALGVALVSLWTPSIIAGWRTIARRLGIGAALLLIGCGPAKVLPLESVGPNETAFVIPLEGNSGAQEKFESVKYLADHKVVSKRIEVPVRERSIGRMWWDYEYIPTVRIVKVDRSLVTREWSPDTKGQAAHAVSVESIESIGFRVGVNLTAFITEEDAPTYLYFHTSKPLSDVVDQNVRGYLQDKLSRAFGQLKLEECKQQKSAIFGVAEKDTIEHFKAYGITISNIGNAGGLEYEDQRIQNAINDTANAQMAVQVAATQKLAQDEKNKQLVATAAAEADAAREFAKAKEAMEAKVHLEIDRMNAEARLKWDGKLPANVLPANSSLLMDFGK